MRIIATVLSLCFLLFSVAYAASDFTNNLGLERPAFGDIDWDAALRANWASLDIGVGAQHTGEAGYHKDISFDADATRNIGGSGNRIKNLYISGNISDDTNNATIANVISAADGQVQTWQFPLNYAGQTVSIDVATTAQSGYLISDDYLAFISKQSGDADLTALADLTLFGMLVRPVGASIDTRTIQGTTDEAIVTNGSGVSGDPTVSMPEILNLGDKTALEIPNSTNPTVSLDGQVAFDTNNRVLRTYNGPNQVVLAQVTKEINVTIAEPLGLAESGTFPIWHNKLGVTFRLTAIHANSDTDNSAFTLYEASSRDFTALTKIDEITTDINGTSVFYTDVFNLSHDAIEDGNIIVYDNDPTDNPAYMNFTIVGYVSNDS